MFTVTCNNTNDVTEFTNEDDAYAFFSDACWNNPHNNYTLRNGDKHIVTKGPVFTR
jgi:hypothetical protein